MIEVKDKQMIAQSLLRHYIHTLKRGSLGDLIHRTFFTTPNCAKNSEMLPSEVTLRNPF